MIVLIVYSVPSKKLSLPGGLASVFAALVRRDTPETEERSVSQDPFLNSYTFTIARLFENAISIAILLGVTLFGIAVSLEVAVSFEVDLF
jgi:hypothetical protein